MLISPTQLYKCYQRMYFLGPGSRKSSFHLFDVLIHLFCTYGIDSKHALGVFLAFTLKASC